MGICYLFIFSISISYKINLLGEIAEKHFVCSVLYEAIFAIFQTRFIRTYIRLYFVFIHKEIFRIYKQKHLHALQIQGNAIHWFVSHVLMHAHTRLRIICVCGWLLL